MASASSVLGVTSTLAAISSCSAWLIRSAATCTGSAVSIGQDRDLGGPGFGVDAHLRADQTLGGGHVDVARPGDHVDRRQLGAIGVDAAVRQQRHRLGPADRPYLVDAEQPGGGQDRRVRQAFKRSERPSACGGLAITSEPTPAVCAGTTFITTLDG